MTLTLTIQGWFYVLAGLWPILHMRSFEMVTGPKTDKWLVKTVALMIMCSGIVLIRYNHLEAALILAVINALSLSVIDIAYTLKRVIPKIYLLDAAVELCFVGIYLILKIQKKTDPISLLDL